jgi:hypothetical protein
MRRTVGASRSHSALPDYSTNCRGPSFDVRSVNTDTSSRPVGYSPRPAAGLVPGSKLAFPIVIGSAHVIAPARRTSLDTRFLYSSQVPIGAWQAPQHTVAEAYNEAGSETAGEPQNSHSKSRRALMQTSVATLTTRHNGMCSRLGCFDAAAPDCPALEDRKSQCRANQNDNGGAKPNALCFAGRHFPQHDCTLLDPTMNRRCALPKIRQRPAAIRSIPRVSNISSLNQWSGCAIPADLGAAFRPALIFVLVSCEPLSPPAALLRVAC